MKNRTIIAVVASVLLAGPAVPVAAQDTQPATMPAAAEMTETQQVSYIMGSQMGRSFAQQNVEVDVEAFVMGMNTALAG
jgi:hypothetical protein